MWPYVLIDAGFALALWTMAWLNGGASATVRRWSAALIASWGLTNVPGWLYLPHMETFVVLTDVALGLAAGIDFCSGRRRPLWLVGLLVSYIAQLMFHLDDDSEKPLLLNFAFAAQILLVGSEQLCRRAGVCVEPWVRPLRYSHSRASRYERRFAYWLGGPPHRAAALRRAREQAGG